MKIEQRYYTKEEGWQNVSSNLSSEIPQLVLVFGARNLVQEETLFKDIQSMYSNSHILICSTAGEILGNRVRLNSIALTAIWFEKTKIDFTEAEIKTADDSYLVGKRLADTLSKENLVHVMVFSDGLHVNGTQLVKGLNDNLPSNVSVTGGLVGDGEDFKKTLVGIDRLPEEGKIVVVGFYGDSLKIGYGSLGGWDPFGIERTITKSKGNILYELDGQPALKIYKDYLGPELSAGLPNTALLFPLLLRLNDPGQPEVVRTILGINEEDQSMIFAGDMPEGTKAQLMKANFERLIDGAAGAASMSVQPLGTLKPDLAILISCIGRRLVLKERTEEEVEAVREILGDQAAIIGFYSYGELCPTAPTEKQCRLHNQTMTITAFKELI